MTLLYSFHENIAVGRPKTTLCDGKRPRRRGDDAGPGGGDETAVERPGDPGLL